jgi:hypothetical protein
VTVQITLRCAATALLAYGAAACALLGPTCLARQERGTVTTIEGDIAAGGIASHLVSYDVNGSQNNAEVSWGDYRAENAPRLKFYATKSACTDFRPPPAAVSADCAVIASAGWTSIGIASGLIVTHGRGNPEVLGSPPAYKIWVIGDAERSTRYSINVTWFFGPDC